MRHGERNGQPDLFPPNGPFLPGVQDCEGTRFESVDFSPLDVAEHTFENCTFSSCHFREMDMRGARFHSCGLENCELVLCKTTHVRLNGVSFKSCKVMGINFATCDKFGFSPAFEDCVLESVAFFGNGMKRGKIVNCRMIDSEIIESDFREADFSDTSFQRVTFQNCMLEKADFRSACGYAIDPATNKLRGARFRLPEAVSFLGFLGIKIEE